MLAHLEMWKCMKKAAGFFYPTCGDFIPTPAHHSSSNEISPECSFILGRAIYFVNKEFFNTISKYAREKFFLIFKNFFTFLDQIMLTLTIYLNNSLSME